jgi:2,5-dihydroxypyridine 5,6-dioxygenase
MVEKLALSYAATAQLVPMFKKHLEMCAVHEGEHVLIHTDPGTYPHFAAAYMAAALELGTDVFQVHHSSFEPEREVIEAWKRADIVLDVSSGPHAYGHIMREAMDAGTRLMRIAESENTMRRLFPTAELKERVLAGKALMDKAIQMRIKSPGGTDLTFYKEGRIPFGIYSCSDVPGRWDVFPAGMVNVAPEEWKGEGVLVLAPGDFMLVLNQYVHDAIRMEIKNGGIIPGSIKGGMQAELLRRWFAQWNAEESYHIAHVGWGCEKRANWLMMGQDHECYYANLLIAFGSNVGVYRDGKTLTKSHIDFACLNNSYWVDDTHIMADGEFVIDALKFKGQADVRRLDN